MGMVWMKINELKCHQILKGMPEVAMRDKIGYDLSFQNSHLASL